MDRYEIGDEGGDAFEPGSGGAVLKNLLGVTDAEQMGRIESAALFEAIAWSDEAFDFRTEFRFETLQAMHRRWLGPIYQFAGEVRTVNVSKGDFMFAPVEHLQASIKEFDATLRENTPCEKLDRTDLVKAVGLVHGELLLVHPFREGNGRIARWLADMMAVQGGMPPLDWGFENDTVARTAKYFVALMRAYVKEPGDLEVLIDGAITRSLNS